MSYTYDNLSKVTVRTIKKLSDNSIVSTETFNYDAAGNVTSAPDSSFRYDTNNRLISFNGNVVSYDLDGNMLSNGSLTCTYDSANRLVSAGGHTYTYNAEDVRIRNLCADEDTTYTYNTNAKLSMLLMKTTGDVVTKYVYGRGLIGEENNNIFKTYHFDARGSTIAITDASGNITDTFAYDTYGKLITRTGTSKVIFGYNGRDGVMTDSNGLIYMRARYYSPEMKRFVNADIVAGKLSNAVTRNRYAYANANPVMNVDPTGLSVSALMDSGNVLGGLLRGLTSSSALDDVSSSAPMETPKNNSQDRGSSTSQKVYTEDEARAAMLAGIDVSQECIIKEKNTHTFFDPEATYVPKQSNNKNQSSNREPIDYDKQFELAKNQQSYYDLTGTVLSIAGYAVDIASPFAEDLLIKSMLNAPRPNNIGIGIYNKSLEADISLVNKGFKIYGYTITGLFTVVNIGMGIEENIENGESTGEIISDGAIDLGSGVVAIGVSAAWDFGSAAVLGKIGAALGTTISPVVGTAIGIVIGIGAGLIYDYVLDPWLDDLF